MYAKDLFEYSQAVRNRYLEQIAALPWEEVVKSCAASFDSIRNIFLHTVDAEDWLVNCVIAGKTKDRVKPNHDEFTDIDSVRTRVKEVETKTKAYVAKISAEELERKVELPRMGKPSILVRVEDALIHAALENIHHFGELIALLWQIDVEPPHLGWINYLQK